jgi:DNA-binding NarL/FixJ family response regulator
LRPRPEIVVVDAANANRARVSLIVSDRVCERTLRSMRTLREQQGRLVLVVGDLDDGDLVAAAEVGVVGVVRRNEATPERLVRVIRAASIGEAAVPPDLLGRLLDQVGQLQRQVLSPRGLRFSGLTDREVAVLRRVAEGMSTAEIAADLSYSQRTIKNVLHDVCTRLQLRNRSHAVAYALRQGLI